MPGRTRRVRLLAAILCIVTVFFLYERNTDRVGRYADYITSNAVGGGSVLRQDKEQEPLAAPNKDADPEPLKRPPPPEPALAPTREKVVEPEPEPSTSTSSSSEVEEVDTTTTAPVATKTAEDDAPISIPGAPPKFYGDDYDQAYDPAYEPSQHLPLTSIAPPHWSKLPENFPITSTIQLPSGTPKPIPKIQKQGKGVADKERLAAVREACRHAWKGYRQGGWGYDEVMPISGGGQNSFNGWGATLVDSLDTLWIMGLKEEFEDAVNKTGQIDFTTSNRGDIPLFEVTIRYLGGMIAAYDVSGKKYRILLDKAVELAEILYSAFDTPNRMPETYYYWRPAFATNKHLASTRAVMAELGTLSLEFTRLSQLTGEPKYYDAIARITNEFEIWQNKTRIPGMWPTDMDASGCAMPVYKAPTTTYKQIPVPDGDTYMIKSRPIEGDASLLDKAKDTAKVNKVDETKSTVTPGEVDEYDDKPMGSVANPAMGNGLAGIANSESNLRHSMDEGKYSPLQSSTEATTNHEKAKRPLAPGVGNDGSFSPEGPAYIKRPSDPLLPNAGAPPQVPHQKRQLDTEGGSEDERSASSSTSSSSSTSNGSTEETTKSTPPQHADGLPAYTDTYEAAEGVEEEEPECIHQGFESVSKNSPETFTLGGKSDSTYEYLPKEYLLLGGRLDQYKDMYLASTKPIIDQLVFRPMTQDNLDILIAGEIRSSVNYTTHEYYNELIPKGEHLTCFAGGMMAMGGKLFDKPEHVEVGRKLTDGCVWAYNMTNSGIMPEGFEVVACPSVSGCKWNESRWWEELDPYTGYRDEQRKEWKDTYKVDDIEAWQKKHAEELAAASASQAAALAAETPRGDFDNAESVAFRDSDDSKLRKRQVAAEPADLDDGVAPAGPQPQAAPTPSPTTPPTATTEDDDDDIWGGYDPYDGPYPSETPYQPLYTPEPPPTHSQYVKQKIEDERMPPGFTHLNGRHYILRPEAIESVFYMYRITGEQYWREMGWKMFTSIEKHTRTNFGHSSIDDITKSNPSHEDKMESFWIAETLKYFYLLFDEPDRWSLDDWVLNTEAHFFERPKAAK